MEVNPSAYDHTCRCRPIAQCHVWLFRTRWRDDAPRRSNHHVSAMRVIGLIDPAQASRVRNVLRNEDQLIQVTTCNSLMQSLRNVDCVVLNTRVDSRPRENEPTPPSRTVQSLVHVPLVVYVAPGDLRESMAFVKSATDVLLKNHTDSPAEIRAALEACRCSSSRLVLRHVCDVLSENGSGDAATSAFAGLSQIENLALTTKTVTRGATIAERTLYRALTEAGLVPVAVIVRVIRAAHAFDLMRFQGYTLERAARALRYSSGRQLSGHIRGITGLPTASTKSISRSDFVEAARWALVRRDVTPRRVAR